MNAFSRRRLEKLEERISNALGWVFRLWGASFGFIMIGLLFFGIADRERENFMAMALLSFFGGVQLLVFVKLQEFKRDFYLDSLESDDKW